MASPQTAADPIAAIARQGRMEQIFATPIFSHVVEGTEALNAELARLILEREARGGGQAKSNQGGWQSLPDFFEWPGDAVAAVERIAASAIAAASVRAGVPPETELEMELHGWAAVNRAGHYNTVHVHPDATWSGVYYVDPGDEPAEGHGAAIEFAHPVVAATMTFFPGILPSARVVRPRAGLVILFPSYLQHSVRMYTGSRPRVCVPFNALVRAAGARH